MATQASQIGWLSPTGSQVGWLSPQVLSNASYMTSQIKDLADKIEQADAETPP